MSFIEIPNTFPNQKAFASPYVSCNETQANRDMAPLLHCIVKLKLAMKKGLWFDPTVVNNLPQNVVSLSISLRQLDKTMFQGRGSLKAEKIIYPMLLRCFSASCGYGCLRQ